MERSEFSWDVLLIGRFADILLLAKEPKDVDSFFGS
jgi:hypothetical protein